MGHKPLTIEQLQRAAQRQGGECLSETYTNKRQRYRWRCAAGHEWEAGPLNILKGSWCRRCWEETKAGKHLVLKDGLQQAQRIAEGRGGRCLSTEYTVGNGSIRWSCANGHEWNAVFTDVKRGTWCPQCQPFVRERLCRAILEALYGCKFPRKRPRWLTGARGRSMELDGYNEDLKLAFEHHGQHHYQEVPHFQRRAESLKTRIDDDAYKRSVCRSEGVYLIEIPYSVSATELVTWIYDELGRIGAPKTALAPREIRIEEYVGSLDLGNLKAIAVQRGGLCLSDVYAGSLGKHRFRCDEGHEWDAFAHNIVKGTWCPGCKPKRISRSNIDAHGLDRLRSLAVERRGELVSVEYAGVNFHHVWKCENGHTWAAVPTDILKGTWCRECSLVAKRDTIEIMRELAAKRGGRCLSDVYVDQHYRLRWQCAEGHEWDAQPKNIKNRNSWCPVCARRRPPAAQ